MWRIICCVIVVAALGACDVVQVPTGDGGTDSGSDASGADAAAGTYYVAVDGSDEADGLTKEAAFRTIAHAAQVVRPGEAIAITEGVYSEALMLEGLGDSQSTITIRGEGGRPILDGENSLSVGIWCTNCTNVVFEGLEFRGYNDIGIVVTQSRDVTVRDLVVHDNGLAATLDWAEGYGIFAEDSSRVTIEECEVYQNGPSPQIPDRWLGTGIDTFNLANSVIRNNRSYNNVGGGLLVEDSTDILVEGNEITGNDLDATVEQWWDGAIWVDGGRDVTLRNNIVRDNLGPGVEISDEDNQLPTGYVLEGNTITGNYFGLYVWNFGTSELPSTDILQLSGNDISGNSRQEMWIVAWECPPDDPCEQPEPE